MNEAVEQMKQDVGNLMKGVEAQGNDGNTDDSANIDSASVGNDDANTNDSDGQVEQISERDQVELDKAVHSGWKTPDDFQGHPDDFIKPREWNRTVALYRRLDRERAERERLSSEVNSFGDRIKNVMEVAKASAINELESKKREAVESADYDEVRRIDTEIDKTNEEYKVDEPAQTPQTLRSEVQDWMEENPWFEKDDQLTNEALKQQRKNLLILPDPSNPTSEELMEALKDTTDYLKYKFPDKFKRKPRAVATSLEGSNLRTQPKKIGFNDLTSEEKTVLSEIERLGGMSRDEYIQAISDMRGKK